VAPLRTPSAARGRTRLSRRPSGRGAGSGKVELPPTAGRRVILPSESCTTPNCSCSRPNEHPDHVIRVRAASSLVLTYTGGQILAIRPHGRSGILQIVTDFP
jgi:hypothetical protein